MLADHELRTILRLAACKHSQRDIAKLTRHARRTIARALTSESPNILAIAKKVSTISQIGAHEKYRRCAGCGRMVKSPCLACQIAELRELTPTRRAA